MMTTEAIVRGLLDEATRYEAAAKQQDRMAEWSGRTQPAKLSRSRAALFREAARQLARLSGRESA